MKNEWFFEWVVEDLDQNGDIHDPQFSDDLSTAIKDLYIDPSMRYCLGVVSRLGNDEDGEEYREYTYVSPEGCLGRGDRKRIPQKFHNQLKATDKEIFSNLSIAFSEEIK